MKTSEDYLEEINTRTYKRMYICDGEACMLFKDNCFKNGGACVHTNKKKHSLTKKLGKKFPPTRFVKVHGEFLVEEVDLAEFVQYYT